MCSLDHMLLVKDLVEIQHRQYIQNQEYMDRYLMEKWTDMEHELLQERGLWGPIVGSRLDKWMLDMTEGRGWEITRFSSGISYVLIHGENLVKN